MGRCLLLAVIVGFVAAGLASLGEHETARANLTLAPTSPGGGAPTGSCSQSTTFFARVWALPATLDGSVPSTGHIGAYDRLICGLVTDGVFANLDGLYTLATDTATGTNTAVAALNLVSSNCTITAHGSPAFAANAGYTGVASSTTVYLDTGCNPTTDGGHFALGNSNMGLWSLTAATGNVNFSMGSYDGTTADGVVIFTAGSNLQCFLNNAFTGTVFGTADSFGAIDCDRASGSGNLTAYWRGGSVATGGGSPAAVANNNVYILNLSTTGGAGNGGTPYQIAAAHFGSHLTAAQISSTGSDVASGTGITNRLCAYLTAVRGSC